MKENETASHERGRCPKRVRVARSISSSPSAAKKRGPDSSEVVAAVTNQQLSSPVMGLAPSITLTADGYVTAFKNQLVVRPGVVSTAPLPIDPDAEGLQERTKAELKALRKEYWKEPTDILYKEKPQGLVPLPSNNFDLPHLGVVSPELQKTVYQENPLVHELHYVTSILARHKYVTDATPEESSTMSNRMLATCEIKEILYFHMSHIHYGFGQVELQVQKGDDRRSGQLYHASLPALLRCLAVHGLAESTADNPYSQILQGKGGVYVGINLATAVRYSSDKASLCGWGLFFVIAADERYRTIWKKKTNQAAYRRHGLELQAFVIYKFKK